MHPIREWQGVTPEIFAAEILPRYEPAVMRGLVAGWPAVRTASLAGYLAPLATASPVDGLALPPAAKGRIGYRADVSGFTFALDKVPFIQALANISRLSTLDPSTAPAAVVQSAPVAECLPGFANENALPLPTPGAHPRIWLGTSVTTPAHIDESHNIACVVAGRRRFTLFPPDAVGGLYLGPLDFTPTGSPISMVDFAAPDFARFPRFRDALSHAQVAELAPGDAIFIPTLWWHHVESLARFNALVNYWWQAAGDEPPAGSVYDALMHAALNLQGTAPAHRQAWGALFRHFLFDADAMPAAHIPEPRRGVLGKLGREQVRQMKDWLAQRLGHK